MLASTQQGSVDHVDVPNQIWSSLNYASPLELYTRDKPYYCNFPCPEGRQSNQRSRRYGPIAISDIRTASKDYSLDKQGFEIFQYGDVPDPSTENFGSNDWIISTYYPVISSVLKARLGDVNVQIFDHTIRKRDPTVKALDKGEQLNRQPSVSAHVDQTFLSGVNRVKFHRGAEAADLIKRRFQIINVWRPLFGPLEDSPLAMCDYRSVDIKKDFMAADLVFPHYVGEQYLVKHNPAHQWHFLSKQLTNEFTLFKCYESEEVGIARCVPHTSFQHPDTPKEARPRESIEFRCMVFYNK